jgi:hypothetical protein
MPIDEARGDDVTLGVDLLGTAFGNSTDKGNSIAHYANIGPKGPQSGAVNDGSASDHDVIGHLTPHVYE